MSACLRGTCILLAHLCCPSAGQTALQGCSPCLLLAVPKPPSAPGTPTTKTVWLCQAQACCHCTTLPGRRQAFSWAAMTSSSHGHWFSQRPGCSSLCCCTSSGSQQALSPWLLQGLPYKVFKLGRRAATDLCTATDLVGFPSHARHAFAAATDSGVRSDPVSVHRCR